MTDAANGSTLTPQGDVQEWFGKLLLEMAERAGVNISEARCRIYAHDLADLSQDQIVSAARYVQREVSGYFPHVAEIRKAALGSPDDRALLAWSNLEHAAQELGAWQSWTCDDGWTAHALMHSFGSWNAFCAMEAGSPEILTKRQVFLAAYREARRQMAHPNLPVRIRGLCESSGNYQRLPAAWTGRLTLDGRVEHEREHQALPGAESVKRLTSATDNEDNNNGKEGEESGAAWDGRPDDR